MVKMIDKINQFEEQIAFFFKVIVPSFLGVSIKIATQMKTKKISILQGLISYVVGISLAVLCAPVITDSVPPRYVALLIGLVAITADKISEYLIYKFNVDIFLTSIFESLRLGIINFFTKK